MPRGDKSAYTDKQKRQAEHIEEGYEDRGLSEGESERRAWATVNKMDHGGKKSGSGRGRKTDKAPARKGGRKGGRAAARKRTAARKTSGSRSRKTAGRSSKKK
jgi:plasmid stabilization system protein ParE